MLFEMKLKKATPLHSSRSKVGQTLSEETSRVASEVQIVRAQEGECRQVIVNLLPFLVCLCKTPTFDSERMFVLFNNFIAGDLGERGAVASQSAQRAGGESAGEAAARDNLIHIQANMTVCSK